MLFVLPLLALFSSIGLVSFLKADLMKWIKLPASILFVVLITRSAYDTFIRDPNEELQTKIRKEKEWQIAQDEFN